MREQMTLNEAESKHIDKAARAFMVGRRPHLHVRAQLNYSGISMTPPQCKPGMSFQASRGRSVGVF